MQREVRSKLRGLASTPLPVLLLVGCSFDVSALPAQREQDPPPSAQEDSGASGGQGGRMSSEPDAGPMEPPPPPQGGSDARVEPPPPDPVDAGMDAGMNMGIDAGMDAGMDAGTDAGMDTGMVEPEPDAATDAAIDASDPDPTECDPDLPCVCPHLLAQPVPGGPCQCALDVCAPDDDCRLLTRGSTVYYFCDDQRTWAQARDRCDDVPGLRLVAIGSSGEDEFVLANVSDKTWLGGSDSQTEGTWRWVGGAVFYDEEEGPVGNAYVNWHDTEPNNDGLSESPADCLLLWYENEVWADASCEDEHGYVCELEP